MQKYRAAIVVAICLLVLSGLGTLAAWQIIRVNSEAPKAVVEEYSLGDTVKLEGSFLESTSEENTDYTICVNSAERMSYNEYIAKYGVNKKKTNKDGNDKSILCLNATITNTGTEMGCLSVYDMRLLPESKNTYYIAQESIWENSEKNLVTWPNLISVKPGTSYTVHVPFTVNTDDDLITKGYIEGKSFTLYLTDWPKSKRVLFELND